MKAFFTTGWILLIVTIGASENSSDRVGEARRWHQSQIDSLFDNLGVVYPPERVLITAYKNEQILQLWIKPKNQNGFLLAREYKFTAYCGKLGPKRKQGDLQIPEGFYYINCFNPRSRFHLALGINYPNASDKILSDKRHPGGDVAIHGSSVTIGCIPIGNEAIEELYIIYLDTKSKGQRKIPVYIFPCQMDSTNMITLEKIAEEDSVLLSFWQNLKQGYDIFVRHKKIVKFRVDNKGRYIYE